MNKSILLNRSITENFDYSEFTCSCCMGLRLTQRFYLHVEKLQIIRRELGIPVYVTSGYRCWDHNAAIGGATKSEHLEFASDVFPEDMKLLDKMYRIAKELQFTGIGRYDTFIHLDFRKVPAEWDNRSEYGKRNM